MGTDIHAFVEFKDGDRWESFTTVVGLSRNYHMFGFMAGVRNYAQAVFAPRGVPSDMASVARSSYYVGTSGIVPDLDWHTPSWLTGDEMQAIRNVYQVTTKWPLSWDYTALIAMLKEMGAKGRVVFWFDN